MKLSPLLRKSWLLIILVEAVCSDVAAQCDNDNVPPVFDFVPLNAFYNCASEVVLEDAIASDETDNNVTITLAVDSVDFFCDNQIVLFRTWTAADVCDNQTTATQIIIVSDEEAPTLIVPESYTAECGGDHPMEDAEAFDNCGDVTLVTETDTTHLDCQFVVTRTFTATDACDNSTVGVQTITIVDTTPPELFIPTSYEADCDDELFLLPALSSDNCGESEVSSSEIYDYTGPNTYLLTRTFTAIDLCGNTSVGIQTIVVQGDYDALGICGGDCPNDADQDGICDNQDDCVGVFDECGVCNGPGEVLECGCQGVPNGACDCAGNVLDALGVCGGDCLEDDDNNGVCDTAEIVGCTYELADNYDPMATRDDGLCEFPCSGDINQNVFDSDGDSAVTIADFLAMLAVFGDVDVDSDGVWDSSDECTDLAACNYTDDPSTPCQFLDVLNVCGGGCEADEDNDGVCDDIDDCIGVVDECGVCNGPGPTEVVIEDITIIYDSVYAENIDTWFVYELGADTTFSITCAPSFSACGDPVSYQGYDYATVLIGDQCWFAENLRSENYENGDAILAGLSSVDWDNTTSGAVAVYGAGNGPCDNYSPDIDTCDPAQSLNEFGRLYNWYAVDDARGLCPIGWHVPTDGEWTVLTDHLDGLSVAGGQMKAPHGWMGDGNGTNSSGFSGLPGGIRYGNGPFDYAGHSGYWWSCSPIGSSAWFRVLKFSTNNVDRSNYYNGYGPQSGFSVRCIQDSQ